MSLARRSITSAGWNIGSHLSSAVILFVRSVLLARLLPIEVFGVYTFASATVALTVVFASFGMDGAFLHRTEETRDEASAASVHFTLKLLFTLAWAAVLILAAQWIDGEAERQALIFLVIVRGITNLAETPQLILVRRVIHRRLAILNFINAVMTTVAAVWLAFRGAGLEALLVTDLITLVLTIGILYLWRPVWRPHFGWSRSLVTYYLRFGRRNLAAVILVRMLDRVDDLWTGYFLGATPLGLYSRAYTFATYPRQVLAAPVSNVASGTYAELANQRHQLSQAFFRTNALLVRSGFYFAGLLVLVAPEFIRLVIGPKWLPMLDTFRLMLLFTLLDPLKGTVGTLFVVTGEPERVLWTRVVQLAFLIVGLFTLGLSLGIIGVALAVDIMLLVGIGLLFWQARRHVDISIWALFGVPSLALLFGFIGGALLPLFPATAANDWVTLLTKILGFSLPYGLVLFLMERKRMLEMAHQFYAVFSGSRAG